MPQCLRKLLGVGLASLKNKNSIVRRSLCSHPAGHRCKVPMFKETRDRFGSVTVSVADLAPLNQSEFKVILEESIGQWRSDKCPAVWMRVPIYRSDLIPAAADLGFRFHHAEGEASMLYQWLRDSTCKLPRFATHQVGVAGVVINEENGKVLVVQDKHKPWIIWKFPGGLAELEEDLGDAAKREVFEETGVKSEFQGVIAFRQQHKQPGAFGRSDLYFLCHMRPLTFDLLPCSIEIAACEWMDLQALQDCTKQSAITQQLIKVIKYGLTQGFDKVHLVQHQFESIYKQGLTFKLHHCNIGK